MEGNPKQTTRCIRVGEVANKLSVGVSSVWYWVKNVEGFPKPFKLGANVTVWYEHAIDAYIAVKAGQAS